MARDFNQNRIANARLVSANIDKFGKTFAIQSPWNADGFSSVNVTVEQAPSDIKQYLEGDNSITVYPVPSNVDKLCEYALASFPNIEDLYLFKNNGVVTIEDDLSYLENLKLIFVASDYVSSYSSYTIITSDYQSFTSVDDYVGKVVDTNLMNSAYTTFTSIDDYIKSYVVYNGVMTYVTNDNKNDLGIIVGTTIAYFGAGAYKVTNDNKNSLYIVSGVTVAYDRLVTNIVEDYTLTIPFVGDTTLTSEYVDSVIAMLSNAEKNAITKVVIPTDFTQESANAIAWGYDFSELPNLNNILYGVTQYDFSVFTINGSGALTSSIVNNAINNISSDKLTLIEKVIVPVDFTSIDDGALDVIDNYNDLTNLTLDTSCYCICSIYTNMTAGISNNKFSTWIWRFNEFSYQKRPFQNITIDTLRIVNNFNSDYLMFNKTRIAINNLYIGNTTLFADDFFAYDGRTQNIQNCHFTNITNIDKLLFGSAAYMAIPINIYIHQNNVVLAGSYFTNNSSSVNKRPTKIYIPRGSLSYYQNATNWSDYSSLFEEYDY